MVKIEKNIFGPRNMGWKRALLTVVWCCMMLYAIICLLLGLGVIPSILSCIKQPSKVYLDLLLLSDIILYPVHIIPVDHTPYCLVAIAVGSPFSDCNWQQGLGRRPDLTRLINQLRFMGCSSRNKDEWNKSCFLVFTRML
jgi:hypothetical protein